MSRWIQNHCRKPCRWRCVDGVFIQTRKDSGESDRVCVAGRRKDHQSQNHKRKEAHTFLHVSRSALSDEYRYCTNCEMRVVNCLQKFCNGNSRSVAGLGSPTKFAADYADSQPMMERTLRQIRVIRGHGLESNASRALATARSISSGVPSGKVMRVPSITGEMTERFSLPRGASSCRQQRRSHWRESKALDEP